MSNRQRKEPECLEENQRRTQFRKSTECGSTKNIFRKDHNSNVGKVETMTSGVKRKNSDESTSIPSKRTRHCSEYSSFSIIDDSTLGSQFTLNDCADGQCDQMSTQSTVPAEQDVGQSGGESTQESVRSGKLINGRPLATHPQTSNSVSTTLTNTILPALRFRFLGTYMDFPNTTDEWLSEFFFNRITDMTLRTRYQNTLADAGFIPLPDLIGSSHEELEEVEAFIRIF